MSDEVAPRGYRVGVLTCATCGHPTQIASASVETPDPPPAWPEGARGRFRCDGCGRVNVVYGCSSCRQGVPVVRRWLASRYVCPWCDARSLERIPGSVFPQLGRRWPVPARSGVESFRVFVHGMGGHVPPGATVPRSASIGRAMGQALSTAFAVVVLGSLIVGPRWVELALLAGAIVVLGLLLTLLLLKK